jgi:glycosyltransferase involved in cell wall biosynthesis
LKRNDGFIVMSDKVLNDLLSFRPDAKYLRINHPVYDQFGLKLEREIALKNLGLTVDTNIKRLLFFGIIRDYKGLDLLIEALSLLGDDYELIVAGEVYGSFDKYKELIDKLKLNSRIKLFNHYISDDQVTNFFSAADVCVLPYKSATQSGIISISKHFEVPIIATDVGGLKESFEHLKSGFLVGECSPQSISTGIELFFEKSLDHTCAEFIRLENKENSWESFAEKLIHFSNEL